MAIAEEFAITEIEDFEAHYTKDEKELGHGGFGAVYKCKSLQDGKEYAVKKMFREQIERIRSPVPFQPPCSMGQLVH